MSDRLSVLVSELRRRRVFRVAAVYLVVAWSVIEAASAVLPMLEAPVWTGKVVLFLVALGFPGALALAWVFDWTPTGVVRTEDANAQHRGDPAAPAGAVVAVTAPVPSGCRNDERSIAVLPLINLSPEPSDEYFADGLTDELIADLSAVRALRVIACASMMRYKGTGAEPTVVARELGVRYVLEGSVRRAKDSLRVTARLLDAMDGTTLWTEKLNGTAEDVFAIQERISRTIVAGLAVRLSPEEDRRIGTRPIADLRAYEFYLQARQEIWRFDPAAAALARSLLDQALEVEGNNALLIATKGLACCLEAEAGGPYSLELVREAERCVARAVALDPAAGPTNLLLGSLHFRRGDAAEAVRAWERARATEPNNPEILRQLWFAYGLRGREHDARATAAELVSLDPLTPMTRVASACVDYFCGRFADAVPGYRRLHETDAGNPAFAWAYASMLALAGEHDEAQRVGARLEASRSDTVFAALARCLGHGLRGERAAARVAITPEVWASAREAVWITIGLADCLALARDDEGALEALEISVRRGLTNYPFLASHDPFLAPLRSHPRFFAVLSRVRPIWEAEAAGQGAPPGNGAPIQPPLAQVSA
jgi:TolB-like protein/tetratricopeptide (TPR) repeat protein